MPYGFVSNRLMNRQTPPSSALQPSNPATTCFHVCPPLLVDHPPRVAVSFFGVTDSSQTGQATARILDYATHFGLLETFRHSGIRPTLLIFTADDSTAKDSAADTIEFFGDAADYVFDRQFRSLQERLV